MLFKEKPIIGMVHLLPLPSSPFFKGSIEEIYDRALQDAYALKNGGIDALIVENGNDGPAQIEENVDLAVISSMSVICKKIVEAVDIPVGVNVVANATDADLAICKASGARFIRATSWANGYFSKTGFVLPTSAKTLRYQKSIAANDVTIMADVQVKNGSHLFISDKTILEQVNDLRSCGADYVIITGNSTGVEPDFEQLVEIKNKCKIPVIIGSGANTDNIARFLDYCDGVIIGTYFKEHRLMNEPVIEEKVKEFMDVVNDIRN